MLSVSQGIRYDLTMLEKEADVPRKFWRVASSRSEAPEAFIAVFDSVLELSRTS